MKFIDSAFSRTPPSIRVEVDFYGWGRGYANKFLKFTWQHVLGRLALKPSPGHRYPQ